MKKITVSLWLLLFSIAVSAQIQTVSVEEFEKQLFSTEGEQLIDVRTPQEFAKYHMQSAKNIDYKSPDFKKEIEKLDKTKPVLVYCLSGARSKASLDVFRETGFKTVYALDGGINEWSKLGKPIVEDLSGKGELPPKEFDAIVSGKGYVLVDFYAPWCAPCLKMLPMVEELEKTYKGRFKLLTVDFDQNRLLSKEKSILAVPYLMIFKDGKKIWEKQGEATREELMKTLESDKLNSAEGKK
jgi:rhodanese-related sulfurtransferase